MAAELEELRTKVRTAYEMLADTPQADAQSSYDSNMAAQVGE